MLERLPNSCENSFYAATEVGPGGSIDTGTFLGASSYVPVAMPEDESAEADTPLPKNATADAERPADDDSSLIGLFVGLAIGLALLALVWAVTRTER